MHASHSLAHDSSSWPGADHLYAAGKGPEDTAVEADPDLPNCSNVMEGCPSTRVLDLMKQRLGIV